MQSKTDDFVKTIFMHLVTDHDGVRAARKRQLQTDLRESNGRRTRHYELIVGFH